MRRREFLITGTGFAASALAAACGGRPKGSDASAEPAPSGAPDLYRISLAEWSLHRALRSGEIDHLDFAVMTKQDFGIDAVEYVNQFFSDKATDTEYLAEMKSRADGEGVRSLLIMCDGQGNLGSSDDSTRRTSVENHYKWVEAAKFLGCHSIRVNALVNSDALPYEEQLEYSAAGLRALCEFSDDHAIDVIVENHGSHSSNGEWLAAVMRKVDHPRCGTLPDFGNFCIQGSPSGACEESYDRYKGVEELMPFAKAVSAKSYDFDEDGNETDLDFERLLRIVLDAGYRGYMGIEYEGDRLSEPEGIRATKALLESLREKLSKEYGNT